jgi:glycosyltransferase involved in cell wall biosynthesis
MNGEFVLPATLEVLENVLNHEDEVIVVINGTNDGSASVVKGIQSFWELKNSAPSLMLLNSEKGLGAALARGIESANGEFIVLSADDLPFGLSDWKAVSELASPVHLAIGSKGHPESIVDRSMARKLVSGFFAIMRKLVLGSGVKDTQGTFFINGNWAKRFVVESMESGFMWTTHLTVYAERIGLDVVEVPIALDQAHGKHATRVQLGDLFDGARGLFRLKKQLNWMENENLAILLPETLTTGFPPPRDID